MQLVAKRSIELKTSQQDDFQNRTLIPCSGKNTLHFQSHYPLAHLLERQDERGDALLAAEAGEHLVGVHALAVAGLHQLGDNALHLLLLRHGPEQLVVEDLGGKARGAIHDVQRN